VLNQILNDINYRLGSVFVFPILSLASLAAYTTPEWLRL